MVFGISARCVAAAVLAASRAATRRQPALRSLASQGCPRAVSVSRSPASGDPAVTKPQAGRTVVRGRSAANRCDSSSRESWTGYTWGRVIGADGPRSPSPNRPSGADNASELCLCGVSEEASDARSCPSVLFDPSAALPARYTTYIGVTQVAWVLGPRPGRMPGRCRQGCSAQVACRCGLFGIPVDSISTFQVDQRRPKVLGCTWVPLIASMRSVIDVSPVANRTDNDPGDTSETQERIPDLKVSVGQRPGSGSLGSNRHSVDRKYISDPAGPGCVQVRRNARELRLTDAARRRRPRRHIECQRGLQARCRSWRRWTSPPVVAPPWRSSTSGEP